MRLEEVQRAWDEAARRDPLWAVLTVPGKEQNRWEPEEFFRTGVEEIAALLEQIRELGLTMPRRRALDFGCGPGRLTQALGDHFTEVDGVDISQGMINLAGTFNRHGSRCRYHVNSSDTLAIFPDGAFDLIYSNITLQHVEPRYARNYIREFIRVISPEGLIVFQLPGRRTSPWRRLLDRVPQPVADAYRRVRRRGRLEQLMNGLPQAEVARLCLESGAELARVIPNAAAGSGRESFQYFCRLRRSPSSSSS